MKYRLREGYNTRDLTSVEMSQLKSAIQSAVTGKKFDSPRAAFEKVGQEIRTRTNSELYLYAPAGTLFPHYDAPSGSFSAHVYAVKGLSPSPAFDDDTGVRVEFDCERTFTRSKGPQFTAKVKVS